MDNRIHQWPQPSMDKVHSRVACNRPAFRKTRCDKPQILIGIINISRICKGVCYNPPAKYVIEPVGQRVALFPLRVNPFRNNAKYWPTHQTRSWLEHQGSSSAPQGWRAVSEIRNLQSSNAFLFSFFSFMAHKQIFLGHVLRNPRLHGRAGKPPGSRPAPPYNNFKVMNFSYK